MKDAHSLETIRNAVQGGLHKYDPASKVSRVSPLDVNADIFGGESRSVEIRGERKSKLIGLLFCDPATAFAKEIVAKLPYFHHRSAEHFDMFCAGFGAYWPPDHHADQTPVVYINGVQWFYSAKAFNDLRIAMEGRTSWKFSGETDLLLLTARRSAGEGRADLDYRAAMSCNLEAMKADGAITSVGALVEAIARFAEQYADADPVRDLSDSYGLDELKGLLVDGLLKLLPEPVAKRYKSAKHFAISDISK